MVFILKLVLIILLNKTCAYIMQDTETILLPDGNPTVTKEIPLTLKVFGQLIKLNLLKSDRTVLPALKVWKYHFKDSIEKLSQFNVSETCLHIHTDHVSSAIINFCDEHALVGRSYFSQKRCIGIRPLRNVFPSLTLIDDICFGEQFNLSFGKPYFIKRLLQYSDKLNLNHLDNFKPRRRYVRKTQQTQKLTMELAVFFDKATYSHFIPLLNNVEQKLRNMILAYINQIQAVFHYSSLGVSIDISLIYNHPDDSNHRHWDIGLYITGTDIYSMERDKMTNLLGATFPNDICVSNHSCVIVEFGAAIQTTSAGFASSFNVAHEIGHLLGIPYDTDSTNLKNCSKYEHIISVIQYDRNQITWSKCSRDIAKGLWERKQCLRDHTRSKNVNDALYHSHYDDLPGREWTAKAQCELFLRDNDANVVTLLDICQILECEAPLKNYRFFAGPALDGTHYALGKECREGECVPIVEPPYIFKYCDEDNWSEWKEGTCKNSCLDKSKGAKVRRRSCTHGSHRTTNCEGLSQ